MVDALLKAGAKKVEKLSALYLFLTMHASLAEVKARVFLLGLVVLGVGMRIWLDYVIQSLSAYISFFNFIF